MFKSVFLISAVAAWLLIWVVPVHSLHSLKSGWPTTAGALIVTLFAAYFAGASYAHEKHGLHSFWARAKMLGQGIGIVTMTCLLAQVLHSAA